MAEASEPHLHSIQEAVILFDGLCGFCSHTVEFVLSRDRHRHFVFAPLQSPMAQALLKMHGLSENETETLVLIEGDRSWTKSTAAVRIARHLAGLWPLLYALVLVPRSVRDLCYNFVARNRYRWFSRAENCFRPKPEDQERFLTWRHVNEDR